MNKQILNTLIRQTIPNAGTIVVVAMMLCAYRAWAMPAAAPPVQNATPGVISYQGYLTDETGQPVFDDKDITFALYNVLTGGTALWTEAHTGANKVPVNNGLFNVLLGSLQAIPSSVWSNNALYLGVKVGNDPEMSPREEVGRVAYALYADRAHDADRAYGLSAADGTPRDAVIVGNDGNVGIGTTEPSGGPGRTLHVKGGKDTRVKIEDSKQGWSWAAGWHAEGDFSLIQEGKTGDRIYVNRDGYVGIGTRQPQAKLDVNGDIKVNGHRPIFFRRLRYTRDHSYFNFRSAYSASQWSCGVVGFKIDGDINENGFQRPLLKVWAWVENNRWVFSFSQSSNEWSWFEALIMCVDNNLVEWHSDVVF